MNHYRKAEHVADAIAAYGYKEQDLEEAVRAAATKLAEKINSARMAAQVSFLLEQGVKTAEIFRAVGIMQPTSRICAQLHTRDGRHKIDFDAAPWFEQADDQTIYQFLLVGVGATFGLGEAIIGYTAKNNGAVKDFLAQHDINIIEFELDSDDEVDWLRANRPQLFESLKEDVPGTYLR